MIGLNWLEFKKLIENIYRDCVTCEDWAAQDKKPLKAIFDYPLQGHRELYSIVGIDKEGNVVLRNEYVTRRLGHENDFGLKDS